MAKSKLPAGATQKIQLKTPCFFLKAFSFSSHKQSCFAADGTFLKNTKLLPNALPPTLVNIYKNTLATPPPPALPRRSTSGNRKSLVLIPSRINTQF